MNWQNITRRCFVKSTLFTSVFVLGNKSGMAASMQSDTTAPLYDRLFILDTWFWKNKLGIDDQNRIVRKLNLPRVTDCRGQWDTFAELLETLDRSEIELVAIYAPLDIDLGKCPEHVEKFIEQLKGRDTFVWITLNSKKYKPSDPEGDTLALQMLRPAVDAALKSGIRISLYPHVGCWAERAEDVFRVASKLDAENVGCTFNLYHWLKAEGPADLEKKAKAVLPRLDCVTINGAPKNAIEVSVEEGILPLGEGDYDVKAFVKTFVDLGFKGPIGLQGYGIGGDVEAKLSKSLVVWKEYCDQLGAAK